MTVPAAHLDVDLDAADVIVTMTPGYDLDVFAGVPGIEFGVPGITGPPGPTGLIKITHGADPDVARPDAPLVYWVGTVQPTNADPDDLLMLKES